MNIDENYNREISSNALNDIKIEKALLGSILLDYEILSDLITDISSDDFYTNANKIIYEEMLNLYRNSNVVDPLLLINELNSKQKLSQVGGEKYIYDLAELGATTLNVTAYVEVLKEKSIKRQLINISKNISETIYRGYETADRVLDSAESMIFKISESKDKKEVINISEISRLKFQALREENLNKKMLGIPSGYKDFDEITNGFHGSDLLILAARPAMGKTAFALNLALNVAKNDKSVLIFSLEMGNEQLYDRLLSIESKIPLSKIRRLDFKADDMTVLSNAMSNLSEYNIHLSDSDSVNLLEIKTICRKVKREHGLDFVLIDYLQLIGTEGMNNKSREQQISEISRSLKILAKELKIPIITLSQLSRAVESRTNKRPMLSDLRESGAIEQDADLVMFLYRKDYYEKNEEPQENNSNSSNIPFQITELIIGKHRNGQVGTVHLGFRNTIQQFVSVMPHDFEKYNQKNNQEQQY